MSVIKGTISTKDTEQQNVSVTKSGDKVLLDVAVSGASQSTGTGTGLELEGSNELASGSMLYGLEYKAIVNDLAAGSATVEVFRIYSDAAETNLISTLTVEYTDATQETVLRANRTDV